MEKLTRGWALTELPWKPAVSRGFRPGPPEYLINTVRIIVLLNVGMTRGGIFLGFHKDFPWGPAVACACILMGPRRFLLHGRRDCTSCHDHQS